MKALDHDLVMKLPFLSFLSKQYLRSIPNDFQSAKKSLKEGWQILVYPGGAWESSRPTTHRDRIDFNGRSGFIRLARDAGVPIVPIISTGAHDGLYIWRWGHRLAKLFRFDKLFRVDTFPIGLSFPFIFYIGPFVPFLPLRRKVILDVLAPLYVESLAGADDGEKSKYLVAQMQKAIDSAVKQLPRSEM